MSLPGLPLLHIMPLFQSRCRNSRTGMISMPSTSRAAASVHTTTRGRARNSQ